jgi:hypothetical protein
LQRLPGVSPKSAQRLALHILKRPEAEVEALLYIGQLPKPFTTHIPHPKMLQREITEMKIKGSIKTNR